MPASDSFNDFLCEQLAPLGRVTLRRMFRSTGMFCNGLMFGLVHEEALYIRVDDQTEAEFNPAASAPPFSYNRNGRIVDLPYRRVPEDLLDQPDELLTWARAALAASQRVAAKTKRTTSPRKTKGRLKR